MISFFFIGWFCFALNLFGSTLETIVADAIEESKQTNAESLDSIAICNGRLTLTTSTPVTTSDVTAATTIYFTPFHGAKISLYSGTQWNLLSFSETSVAVPATTTTPFDIFAYSNSGTLALEALSWTNDTTRATALATQNGVYVKSGATTRRYIGTARTTSVSGQTEDSTSKRFLWNACNRVTKWMKAVDTTDTWNYTTATWRQARATSTNQVEFVIGLKEEPIQSTVAGYNYRTAGNGYHSLGVGLDSTSTNSAFPMGANNFSEGFQNQVNYFGFPNVGYHYLAWLEIAQAQNTNTFTGDSGLTYLQGGMIANGNF